MAKKSLKNKDFSANCKQTAEISWFRTLMPPNKHDLGAKIQILNPNAPNYLFFKINLVRFQKKLANSWTFSECKWETLKLRIFELILNYFWIPKLAIFGGFWKSENDILKTRIILTFWKFKIGNFGGILKIWKWHFKKPDNSDILKIQNWQLIWHFENLKISKSQILTFWGFISEL